MSSSTLLLTIFISGAGFFLVAGSGYAFFTKFMRREKEAHERFRAMRGTTPPDER